MVIRTNTGSADEVPATSRFEGPDFEALRQALSEFGLNGYQIRVFLALLTHGSSTAKQLAYFSGVPRTSTHAALNELQSLGLTEPLPGRSQLWLAPPRAMLVERLWSRAEDEFKASRMAKERARATVVDLLPDPPVATVPHVRIVRSAAEAVGEYGRRLADARHEVLVFNKGPYLGGIGEPNPAALDLVRRGVSTRALYQASDFDGPQGAALRKEADEYVAAGVQARVVDELPLKLALFDGRVALFPLEHPDAPDPADATNLHFEHPGFATFAKAAFEHYWAQGRPYRAAAPREAAGTARDVIVAAGEG